MKFQIRRDAFLAAAQTAATAVPHRSPDPILLNLFVEAREGNKEVVLRGTDLEMGVEVTVAPADVTESGNLLLPAARIVGLLREARAETVICGADGMLAVFETGSGRFDVVGVEPETFPKFPTFPKNGAIKVESRRLREMVQRTSFAVSPEITRYAMTGLRILAKGSTLQLVATDGKRLAVSKWKMDKVRGLDFQATVPPKAMHLLERVLTEEDEHILLHLEENQVKFLAGKAFVWSRLVEGNYPDFEKVIPKDPEKRVKFDTAAMQAALRTVSVLASSTAPVLDMEIADGKMTLTCRGEAGVGRESFPVVYDGESYRIAFHPQLLMDALRVLPDTEGQMEFRQPGAAAVLRIGAEFTYVVMPLTRDS